MLYLVRMDVHLPHDMPAAKADEIKARSELVLAQRFARIATVEQALAGPEKKLAAA